MYIHSYLAKLFKAILRSLLPTELYKITIVVSYNNLDFEMHNTQYNTWLININFQKQEMDHFSERMQVAPVERVPQVFCVVCRFPSLTGKVIQQR